MYCINRIIIVLTLLVTSNAMAYDQDLIYGKIDSYELGKGYIIIGDIPYKLTVGLKVYDESKRSVSRTALTKDHDILFRLYRPENKNQEKEISEIYLIPPGT